jgi:hypothetical protein
MKSRLRVTKVKSKQNAKEKKEETQVEKVNHILLNSSEFRNIGVPSAIVWGAAQMDPWVLGGDVAVKSAFKKIAEAIWHEGSSHVDDLAIHTVIYFLIFFIYSDRLFPAYATPF